MQMDFWSLIITVPFSSHNDEEMVTHVNEVPISAGFLGSRNALMRDEGTEVEKKFHLDG